MKRFSQYFGLATVCMLLTAAVSCCGVYEWPAEDNDKGVYEVHLSFDTELPKWEHSINRSESEPISGSFLDRGIIRHTVEAYPLIGGKPDQMPAERFSFTEDLSKREGYDCSFSLQLDPGDYRIFVWSDFIESEKSAPRYDAEDISRISLSEGPHTGNSDYLDAFRGWADLHAGRAADGTGAQPVARVQMQRPLAKYELIADDVSDFLTREARKLQMQGRTTRNITLNDYKVVITYVGFMPDTYNLLTDRPVDSATGVSFASELRETSEGEASLGFDYIFVKDDAYQSVTVQIGIYEASDGSQISLSGPIRVPLQRSRHTIVRGSFLLMNSSGGIGIDSDFSGDHNQNVGFTYTE